jgi:hypothetical protein
MGLLTASEARSEAKPSGVEKATSASAGASPGAIRSRGLTASEARGEAKP